LYIDAAKVRLSAVYPRKMIWITTLGRVSRGLSWGRASTDVRRPPA